MRVPRVNADSLNDVSLTPPLLSGKVVIVVGSVHGRGAALAAACTVQAAHAVVVESQATLESTIRRFGAIDVLIDTGDDGRSDGPAVPESASPGVHEALALGIASLIRRTDIAAGAARAAERPLRIIHVSSCLEGGGALPAGTHGLPGAVLQALSRALAVDDDPFVTLCSIQACPVSVDGLARLVLWAATAPAAAVHRQHFSEAAFAADPEAASSLQGPLQASAPLAISPATYVEASRVALPGAYMHLLENAQGVYPSVARALEGAAGEQTLHAYPDPKYRLLRDAIANDAGTTPDHVAVAAGSSELIDRLLRMFCAPGDSIVVTEPTWSFFKAFAQRWQVVATAVPMLGSLPTADMRHDLDGLLAAITPRTRLVYLVNPCQPTGSMLDPRALETFVQRVPGHVVVVIDEAYLQYADADRRPNLAAWVDRTAARLVLLRSFSKFFALGGLRVGYALASPATVRLLSRAEIPFAVSAPAVLAAQSALADAAFRKLVFEANREGRQQLFDGLAALALPTQPSQANFVLCRIPVAPQKMRDDLLREGLVLPRSNPALPDCMSLTIGRKEHNAQMIDYLKRVR